MRTLKAAACWTWLAPLFVLALAIGSVWPRRAGGPGDYYGYVLIARLHLEHPGGIPFVIPDFNYPLGEAKSAIPEAFSEPVTSATLGLLARWANDPLLAVWLGLIMVATFNILGTWIFFWRREARASRLAVFVGWSVIALVPWWWARASGHWHLAGLWFLLPTLAIWHDFFVDRRVPRARWLWGVALLHGLLLGQSIYYGAFMVIFAGAWSLAYARRIWTEPAFRHQWGTLVGLAALGFLADAAWVVHGYGGLAQSGQTLATGKHELWLAYNYSNRVRELMRGAPGSPSGALANWFSASGHAHGVDGEGFPAPFPKMALLLCGALFAAWPSFRKSPKRASLRPLSAFAGLTLLIVLLTGMQEITWIKFHVLHRIFPFLGSYARMFIVLIIVLAFWFAGVARAFEQYVLKTRRPRLWLALGCSAWLAALLFDYGFNWRLPILDKEVPCLASYEVVRKEPRPVFLSGEGSPSCRVDLPHVHSLTSAPIVQRFWENPPRSLAAGSAECTQARARILTAQKAWGGPIWWWVSGKSGEFQHEAGCFKPGETTPVFRQATPDGGELVLSHAFVTG